MELTWLNIYRSGTFCIVYRDLLARAMVEEDVKASLAGWYVAPADISVAYD